MLRPIHRSQGFKQDFHSDCAHATTFALLMCEVSGFRYTFVKGTCKIIRISDNTPMTKDQAITYFGTQVALAEALGIGQSSISEWDKYPPELRQIQLQTITHGKLRAEPECFIPQGAKA